MVQKVESSSALGVCEAATRSIGRAAVTLSFE